MSVTAHGTVMAYVVTTLFVMGFGYFVAETALDQPLRGRSAAWLGFWTVVLGLVMAAVPILLGHASVLYTFYPPLIASPFYYGGVLVVVTRSWVRAALIIRPLAAGKGEHPRPTPPLALFVTFANPHLLFLTQVAA